MEHAITGRIGDSGGRRSLAAEPRTRCPPIQIAAESEAAE